MIFSDFHVHSSFSDGKNTPEEMVQQALSLGMREMGFSDHGYAFYDTDCCIPEDKVSAYRTEIRRLQKAYSDKIRIRLGVERDAFAAEDGLSWDYVIGSVHYVKAGELYFPVDYRMEDLQAACRHFGGDYLSLAESYFETVGRIADLTCCDIIGHFDLISKLNEKQGFLDEQSPRYIAAWKKAADALLAKDLPFEINTGAISRGYKTGAYPSLAQIEYIAGQGGRFILSSDAHRKEDLCCDFERQLALAEKMGLRLAEF